TFTSEVWGLFLLQFNRSGKMYRKSTISNKFLSVLFSILVVFTLIPQTIFVQEVNASGSAWDFEKDHLDLDVRFWEDEQPDLGFYLNGASQYEFNTNQTPGFGQDWPVMDLGRGLYTGYDYINQLPETYFNDYINKVKSYVEGRNGN